MDTFEAIVTRRSIRKYMDVPVEWDKIGTILEAAKWTPSSGNIQNWKIIVVLAPETRHKIAEACLQQWWMETAPVHMIVCAEPDKVKQHYGLRGERLYSVQNCAATTMNMMLAAHNMGMGTCWVGAFIEERLKDILSIPDQVRPQAVITLGYADERPNPPARFTLEDIMFFRGFGGQIHRIKDLDATLGYTSGMVRKMIDNAEYAVKNLKEKALSKLRR